MLRNGLKKITSDLYFPYTYLNFLFFPITYILFLNFLTYESSFKDSQTEQAQHSINLLVKTHNFRHSLIMVSQFKTEQLRPVMDPLPIEFYLALFL